MRIAIATAVYYPMINGVAVFTHNLAVGLARRGHEVLVLCPSQTGEKHIKKEDGVTVFYLDSVDVKVYPDQIHQVPEKKKFRGYELPQLFYRHGLKVSVLPTKEVNRALNKFRPDVVHVQVSDPIGLSVVSYARKHEIPVVTTEHNQPEVLTEPMHLPKFLAKPTNAMLTTYFRSRQKKSDFVTMPTEEAIHNLIGKTVKNFPVPVAAVSNGVDLTNFQPGKASKQTYEKYDIKTGVPTVIYVGRIDPEKKVGIIIRAFGQVLQKIPEAQLVIVGDGVERAKLTQKVRAQGLQGSVKLLGRVVPPDLYELYRVGDVFATASEIETQGIVLIEAAATGLPLIAVNKGAVSEVCKDGENGILCTPGSVTEIKTAMERILSDKKLQKKFAAKSLEIAKEHDFERTLDRFSNIYKRLLYDEV